MLSPPDPDSRIGNLLGDFVHGSISGFPPRVAAGIRMHRAVDAFTDSHPSVGSSRRLLSGRFRHHSRIIVDVLYDHLLIDNWDQYESRPLDEFAEEIYALLKQRRETVSGPLRDAIPHMVRNRWLTRNRDLQGVEHSLRFLSERMRRPVRMEEATREFVDHEQEFREDFDRFFPEVRAFAGSS